jgi:hypothetical protein
VRYEGCLLTVEESATLIDEVDRWCRRTGTNYNRLVVVAGVGVTTRHKVRLKGQRITLKVANRLRVAMMNNRFGISKEKYRTVPKPWRREPVREMQERVEIEMRRVVRDICPRCGSVRYDYVCACLSAKQQRVKFA